MASKPADKISKAKARLLLNHPFFATLLLRTQVMITDHGGLVDTAATDGENIYFNPDFLDKLSIEDTMTVLCHEVGHDSLLHSLRLGVRNPELWNEAGDHAINLMLEDQGMKAPSCMPGGWFADAQYKGYSADRIYDDLRRKQDQNPKPPKGKGGGDGKGGALAGDVLPGKPKSPAEQAAAEQKAKQRVAAAATMARTAGKLKGDLARMVDEFLEPKVPWTEVLRQFMLKIIKARDNWARKNRRFSFYLPTRRSVSMGPMLFIPDTSGSMFGDDMEKICSEMAHCAVQTQPEEIRVIWTDAAVQGEQTFTPAEFAFSKLKPQGGGGTDMRVGLKHAEKYEPQVVVLMTDGYTPWPSTPCPFPVICLCTTTQKVPEWMEVIRI